MEAGPKAASIAITLEHHDPEIRELYFEQLLELKEFLHSTLEEEWSWLPNAEQPDGRIISQIIQILPNVSVFNQNQWGDIISFFKPRIIALDSFWENARYTFEDLK